MEAMNLVKAFLESFTWRMAWRDSRSSRRKLLLFSSSIVIGIAALVAINSFGQNLRRNIDVQAKALLGADLVITARDPFTPEMEELFKDIGGEQAREVIFSSMVVFPKTQGTRLVQVRALEPGFPFYGEFETAPSSAARDFHNGGALLEESLLLMFNAKAGDPVRIGALDLEVTGALQKVPGENAVFSTIAPRVYIPMNLLDRTKLVQNDSFARFKVFFKLPDSDVEALVRRYKPKFEKLSLNADTVEERKANLGNAMENLNRFLNLGGYIALLLGAIGVASAIHVHVKQKTSSVAVLRCLGCTVGQSLAIYLLQAVALGIIGSVLGALLGIVIQFALPSALGDFLPFQVEMEIAWAAVGKAMAAGFAVCIIFGLAPLMGLRRISPMAVLRSFYEPPAMWRDPAHWAVIVAGLVGLILLAKGQSGRWSHALGMTGGLAAAFALLAIAAQISRALARKLISPRWPYAWRQGMANLYRPQNRTLLLLLSLGLGAFLVLTLFRTHQLLTQGLIPATNEGQPNAALFDIQADQVEGVKNILAGQNLQVLQDAPMVTMRLASVKGTPVRELLRRRDKSIPRWVLRREYRSTYRDHLESSEVLVKGNWPAKTASDVIPISVEEGIAHDLGISLGDEMVFDVQGILMTNQVASLRKVDWKRVQPNFFVVFPTGVLEDAPGFHILTTRVPDRQSSAAMQRAVVQKFPNVSVIDLALILDTVDAVLQKVGFVIRFMASFTVVTGLLVLAASVLAGRYQRMRETLLLRTLGASQGQIHKILVIEYLLLGSLAAITGVFLAEAGTWALAKFLFKINFEFAIWPALLTAGAVTLLTVVAGLVANRGVLSRPPLEILRGA